MSDDSKPAASRYPECDKLDAVHEQRELIVAFLDWCEEHASSDITVYQTHSHLAHRFLGINEETLERERRMMLKEIRDAQR